LEAGVTSWQLAGFTQERELGSGGSGRVVLARHDGTGNEVAIKYLAEWLSQDAAHLASFRTEAQLMAGLVDPHLVALYEYVETTAGAAIVMDLLNGVALRTILDEGGPLTPEAALALLKGSLLGLAALHAQGVVHRDYKPENVMVDAAGDTKLVDYGIAAPVGEIAGVSGTPLYMAPEQWRGEPSNAATDVYAATATFVECLTGHPMFPGTTVGALLHQHLTAAPPLEELPEAVRPLATAGLAKDPAERIGDATVLLAQLGALAPAAYGPDWERHGRAHLAARAVLLALLFAHPERVAHEQAFAQTNLATVVSARAGSGDRAGGRGAGGLVADAEAAVTAVEAARRRRVRPLSTALGLLVLAVAALALLRHSSDPPASSNAAFEQGQATVPVVTPTPTPNATLTPSPTPSPTPVVVPPAPPTFSVSPVVPPPVRPTSMAPTIAPTSPPVIIQSINPPPPTSPPPIDTSKQPVTSPTPTPLPPPVIKCPPTIPSCVGVN
jgi:eukaryotic-like serine/threonine-protein kinase